MSKPCNGQCGSEDSVVDDKFQGRATAETGSQLSTYKIPKMDCPSEERMIRMALTGVENIQSLSFDLSGRTLEIIHHGETGPITSKLENLGLGASLQRTEDASAESVRAAESSKANESGESGTLWILLAINALMFLVEMTMGLIAQSAGLIADSLDMLADAAVYGLALYAVGHGIKMQVRAAHVAGILQLILAAGVLVEVGRRFLFGSDPQSLMMMAVASVALIANISCLLLIAKHREGGAHMKASWIFSANDVVINLGVILAGLLVAWTGTNYPDLIIGGIVGAIVLMGAKRILALKG
ncbi:MULTISPECIES: cation transporter [Marinobacter]|jgi:cation transport ATPase|uniref:Heavy metal/H+ antiporter, CDF family n=6 Tax=Marinobacter TaxID=2742 RepID=A1U064_MARN8|nr:MULTISPECIES: cation transporter [Marinobacter]ABM18383.1 heavy metal/H+ antiporter, CDF family [Marinobacter nauticus VT8]ABM20283.1 heavy metal/H+ antiporter, CDF family [Marinobacter nauticus VT8]MAC22830.1 cation transporter [Marinobacter sp.]MCC4270615.1 cation transporter [Marinobacter nauticus]RBP68448.1 cation efflux family protein [Marinobacter nauticus]|tara:strand:+ start:1453 stop:2349 length:897 start_codon:yes stop_codon:yes gene_type:complete